MAAASARPAPLLLLCAILLVSCDRSQPEPPSSPAPAVSRSAALKASDAACALPQGRFARHRTEISGSILDYPSNLVIVERSGRLLWNSVPVDSRRLAEFTEIQAGMEPPPILAIAPDRGAPCAVVQRTLSVALQIGRCSPKRCALEWPGAMAPPLLPEPSKLLGEWVLVSIDASAPPRQTHPIEVTFTDGAIVARSQCIHWDWRIGEEDGRLRLRTPPGPVAMCARATSQWEDRFGAAMAAAGYIQAAGEELIVGGPKGNLRLKRPGGNQAGAVN